MIKLFRAAFLLMTLIASCSSPATPTLPPSPLLPTRSMTIAPLPLLPTLNPDVLLLTPNQPYYVLITFADSPPAAVSIQSSDQSVSFALDAQASASETPNFDSTEPISLGWGMPYILYALNRQSGRNTAASRSTEGALILSLDGRTLAYFLCNEHGGRGQWCYEPHLWLFDLPTGEARQADFGESSLLYISNLHFNHDSQTLIGDSCLKYANAYFGFCGTTAGTTWDVSTGQLLDLVILATPNPGS
jgi:hypothetical protein